MIPKRFSINVLRQVGRRPTPARIRRSVAECRSLHQSPQTPPQRPSGSDSGRTKYARVAPVGLLVGGGIVASIFAIAQQFEDIEHEKLPASFDSDNRDPSLPRYRLADVRQHDASSPHPWIIYGDKVYDITDWVGAHPGGDVILRAAGGSVEPYWNIFSIHKSDHVREILEQYVIGYIDAADLVDGRPAADAIEDPFKEDPVRDPRLVTHTLKPRNAEPPNEELDRTFKTPNELFYVRNHMWVPVVEEAKADDHALEIELPDGETRRYTLAELKERFPTHKVTAVLQCSGSRRSDMTRQAGKTNGLQWGVGAISNAEWEGVRLADVLADAGLTVSDGTSSTRSGTAVSGKPDTNALHVQFSGLEAYGSSIPLTKAIDPRGDVLLAFGMNGQPLPRDHGFPLRAVVPGTVAARSVKWLNKIVVSDEESHSQWQRRDYKSFGPNEGANPNWDRAVSMQETPVTSAITAVWVGDCIRRGKVPWMSGSKLRGVGDASEKETTKEPVAVQGYAYSGGGRGIARVDISLDGGKTWDQAELVDDCSKPGACLGNKNWTWKRWRYVGQLPSLKGTELTKDAAGTKACTTLVVKATDDSYNSQPESHSGIYNARGNLATAWHRVRVCPDCKSDGKGTVWSTGKTYGCGFAKDEDRSGAVSPAPGSVIADGATRKN
ncbi:mitochondrial sulfite oxidase [Echria macrotheca]|uniref:Nitrate reductase [NADPH] n=1 Tax=Echria macrotheca TaxID=438768 RepID=A0AAJ0B7A0_9PEZI|nr:mitochondrial sulfite oxidase [Echria macrotheca]